MHFRLEERIMTMEEQERFWCAVRLTTKMAQLPSHTSDEIWAKLPNDSTDDRGVPTQELVDYLRRAYDKATEKWPNGS